MANIALKLLSEVIDYDMRIKLNLHRRGERFTVEIIKLAIVLRCNKSKTRKLVRNMKNRQVGHNLRLVKLDKGIKHVVMDALHTILWLASKVLSHNSFHGKGVGTRQVSNKIGKQKMARSNRPFRTTLVDVTIVPGRRRSKGLGHNPQSL